MGILYRGKEKPGDDLNVVLRQRNDGRTMLTVGNTGWTLHIGDKITTSEFYPGGEFYYHIKHAPINGAAFLAGILGLRNYLRSDKSRLDRITASQFRRIEASCNPQMAKFLYKIGSMIGHGVVRSITGDNLEVYENLIAINLSELPNLPDNHPLVMQSAWAAKKLKK